MGSPPGRGLGEGATVDVDVLLRTVQQRDDYHTQAVDVRRDLQRLQSEQAGLREYRIAATTKCADLEKVLDPHPLQLSSMSVSDLPTSSAY